MIKDAYQAIRKPRVTEKSTILREKNDGLYVFEVQEQLNNMHVDDVPDRYRTWLDAYIKAMRRLEEP